MLLISDLIRLYYRQSILFFILAVAGVFKDVKIWEMKEVNSIGIVLQNFAICIEMFIAALAHHFSFSYQPYVDPDAPEMNCCASCWYMWNVSDMRRDVCEHIRHIGHSVTSIGFPRRSTDRRPDRSAARFLSDSSDHSQDNDTETNPLLKSSHPERSGSPGVDHSFSEPVFVPVSNRLVLLAANANNGQVVADNDPAPSVTQQTTNRDMLATNGVC
ncbi:unnamed protein product [Calicophoron daubneyi]|uniref:Transmembrane protein 184C n=1 Tax=Calicophoron daubneyi TaxID=300641 RepID=A0AAV2T3L3_CALDB